MLLVAFAFALLAQTPAPPAGTPCTDISQLVGTWRVVEVDGEPRAADTPTHKHVTPTHFALLSWNPADDHHAQRAHAGRISLADGTYTENVDYGFGVAYDSVPAPRRQGLTFRCWVDGDRWHLRGTLLGKPRAETWVRVAAAR